MKANYCEYCRRAGLHEDCCPTAIGTKDAKETYLKGWANGRRGTPLDEKFSENKTYRLGYGNGEVALEAYENGC